MGRESLGIGGNLCLTHDVTPAVNAPGFAVLATERAKVVGGRIDRPIGGRPERAMAARRSLARRADDLAQVIDGPRGSSLDHWTDPTGRRRCPGRR